MFGAAHEPPLEPELEDELPLELEEAIPEDELLLVLLPELEVLPEDVELPPELEDELLDKPPVRGSPLMATQVLPLHDHQLPLLSCSKS